MSDTIYAGKMPILALRGLAVFPEQTVHFEVGRAKSAKALEAAMAAEQLMLLVPQKDLLVDDPKLADLYAVGTVVRIKQILRSQDENTRVLVTGLTRARITELQQSEPYFSGLVESIPCPDGPDSLRSRALRREANSLYAEYVELSEHPAQMIQLQMLSSNDNGFVADSIAQNSGIDFGDKAKLLLQLYGVPMIAGELRRYLRDYSRIRVSRSLRDTAYRVLQCRQQLTDANGREPSIDEIAQALDLPPAQITAALDAITAPVSLYEPVYSEGGDALTVMDQVRDRKNTDEQWIESITLREAISHLSEREKRILALRFEAGRTQMEVAGQIGISQAQVSRLEKSAIRSIRKAILPS